MTSAAKFTPLEYTPTPQLPLMMRRATNPQPETFMESSQMAATTLPIKDLPPFTVGRALPDLTSTPDAGLCNRIYKVLASDETIRSGLKLDKYGIFIKDTIIPILVAKRSMLLASPDDRPDLTHAISSKHEPRLQFDSYGKASIRVKNGTTYITLPHMTPLEGAMKVVKYMIAISHDERQISLAMMSKIKKEIKPGIPFRTAEICQKFIAIANILQTFKHPNILTPTDLLIPSSKKGYELITPKCEMDLFNFLQTHQTTPIEQQARDCIRFMREITSAMKYIYDRGYLHCDLKPENILLQKDSDGALKTMLMDFDLLSKYDDRFQKLRGTAPYVPPSYVTSGTKNDVSTEYYALGRTLHADPKTFASFTRWLSKLEKDAKKLGDEPLSKAILHLIGDITSLSDRLTHDKISSYTTVLNELDKAAIQFETALPHCKGTLLSDVY
jgi:serine/threonine protein kinase